MKNSRGGEERWLQAKCLLLAFLLLSSVILSLDPPGGLLGVDSMAVSSGKTYCFPLR